MQPSIALTEFQIRKPLLRDLKLDALPPELQETAADLLCTLIDAAALKDPRALEALRGIASKLAPKATRQDRFQSDRPFVVQCIELAKASISEGEAPELAARFLHESLGLIDPAFRSIDPAALAPMLRTRSGHELAATLTIECAAFGETKPGSKAARADAIARVKHLSIRAQDA